MYLFTIFTPTYNRANLIHRVFESLTSQSYKNFEWIVLDDGSTDNTHEVLLDFQKNSKLEIKIIKRENKGKVFSINEALDHASGELFVCFDSDDWCEPDALNRLAEIWNSLTVDEKLNYSGISCLKMYTSKVIVGENYNRMNFKGHSYVDRFNKRISGDKWEIIRTDIHKKFKYDIHITEKYMAPEYSWLLMGVFYKTIFVNEPLSIIEYQVDGISKNNLKHRVCSSISTKLFYRTAWVVASGPVLKFKCAINHIRFSFHSNTAPELPFFDKFFAYIPAYLMYVKDSFSLMRHSKFNKKSI
jgi:glycosyltransferase involved in cell wall biosynthesis